MGDRQLGLRVVLRVNCGEDCGTSEPHEERDPPTCLLEGALTSIKSSRRGKDLLVAIELAEHGT